MTLRRVISDTGKIFTGNAISSVASALQGVLVARWLGPNEFGRWNLLLVVLSYNLHAHLGILNGLSKDAPRARGMGKPAVAETMIVSSFWACLLISLLTAIGTAASVGIPSVRSVVGLKLAVLLAASLALNHLFIYYLTVLRVDERFQLLSVGVAIQALATLILISAARAGGILTVTTAAGALAMGYALALFVMMSRSSYHRRIGIDWQVVRGLIITGIPLIGIAVANSLLLSVDRWVLAPAVSGTEFGYYALGASGAASLALLPASLSFVIFPRMMHMAAAASDKKEMIPWLRWPLICSVLAMSWILGILVISLPVAMAAILPSYSAAIPVVAVFFMCALVLSLLPMLTTMMISLGLHRVLLVIQAGTVAGLTLGGMILLKRGGGGEEMAIFSLAVRGLSLAIVFIATYRILKIRLRAALYDAVILGLPIAGLGILVFDQLHRASSGGFAIAGWLLSLVLATVMAERLRTA